MSSAMITVLNAKTGSIRLIPQPSTGEVSVPNTPAISEIYRLTTVRDVLRHDTPFQANWLSPEKCPVPLVCKGTGPLAR